MTDPAEGKTQGEAENEKMTNEEEAKNDATTVDVGGDGDEIDPDDSKAHLISANGGAGGGGDLERQIPDVKYMDGTNASSEAEVSFNGLGKDEVMKYADEPFWKRLRLILFILFWVGWFAMLVTAIIIIVMAPRCPPRPDLKWYQKDTVYQVLPESFKDSNDDGKGDFQGLKDKADYVFDDLGVKAIWLSAMYSHDEFDGANGVIDHKATADSFAASADDLKSWMKSLRKEDKRIILDLIPNHTSKKHPWFHKSENKEGKYKDYYVWAPAKNGQPPNNWQSVYGGSAWTMGTNRSEYYLHQFSEEHPDLNLRNPDVLDEIKDIMKFWLEAGVSGFHVRDVDYLVENPSLEDDDADKIQTRNYNGTLPVLEELRKVVESFSDKPGRERLLFATMKDINGDEALSYWGTKEKKRLHIVAPTMVDMTADKDATFVKSLMEDWLSDEGHQWMGYALGGDSVSRIATRMATPAKLTIAHAIQLLMPGTPFNYYGDEFGQKDVNVPVDKQVDDRGRDNFRTPMQWDASENAGFTKGTPYLPIGTDYKTNHVDAGTALFSGNTPLQAFKKLVALRGEKESLQFGKTKVCAPDSDLLLIMRKAERFPFHLTLINMGTTERIINLGSLECVETKQMGKVLFHTRDEQVDMELDFHDNSVALEKGDVVVVEFAADEE